MGKLNIANINTGLNKVKSITEALANVARYELVPIELIQTADYNPFAEQDTDESRYQLAMSIQANGLIEPLAVNKKAADNYKLISGEHRFTAIRQYLSFKNVPCMVFEGISDDEAQLKLYEANTYREYSSEQKFKRYQELEQLLCRMKESGKFSGGIQKAIAERLGVSERQVRKYKTIGESLSTEQQESVVNGEMSVNDAYKIARPSASIDEPPDVKSGTGSAFYETPTNSLNNSEQPVAESTAHEQPDKEFDQAFWDDKIKCALKHHYNEKSIFLYYVFQVPTTQEAIKKILKPSCGYIGCSVIFPNEVSGFCDCRSAQMEIEYKRERTVLTYSQVDGYIREMIRSSEWLAKADARAAIEEKLADKKRN